MAGARADEPTRDRPLDATGGAAAAGGDGRRDRRAGIAGAPTSRTASGAPSARTTRPTATPGTSSRTTSPVARVPLGRGRPARASATTTAACASRSRSGTARDPILKERLFGLTGPEGNHGEDVKEVYYYLDATPTPRLSAGALPLSRSAAFPYDRAAWTENARRDRDEPEFELADTGIFDDGPLCSTSRSSTPRPTPTTSSIRITRRRTAARRRRRSTCCRRSGSATPGRGARTADADRPHASPRRSTAPAIRAEHRQLGGYHLARRTARRPPCCSPRTSRTPSACGACPSASRT